MSGFLTLDQSLPFLIVLAVAGIILLWFSARALRAVARDIRLSAQVQENIAREAFENDLVRTRWRVWREYTAEIINLADWFNAVRAAYLRDQHPDLVLKYDQNGAEMVWAFGYEEIGVEIGLMNEIIETLILQVRQPLSGLRSAWKMEGAERERHIAQSWEEVSKIWEEHSPRLQRKLKEIELKIRPFMPLRTEPLAPKEREKQTRRWLKAEQLRQKKEKGGWFFFGRKGEKETSLIRKL